jgi:hypothetical protein
MITDNARRVSIFFLYFFLILKLTIFSFVVE